MSKLRKTVYENTQDDSILMQKGANSTLQKFVLSELNCFFKRKKLFSGEIFNLAVFYTIFIIILAHRTSYIETYMKAFEIYVHFLLHNILHSSGIRSLCLMK